MISIYTDGSSGAGGGKPGGWAWVIVRDDTEVLAADYGGDPSTTNNIMELTAAIKGMEAMALLLAFGKVKGAELRELVSDSQYTLGISSGGYTPGKNLELAERAKQLGHDLRLRFRWVRGHSGDVWNERCDSLAGKGKREHTPARVLAKEDAKKAKRFSRRIETQSGK